MTRSSFFGMKTVVSDLIPQAEVPNKKHKRKTWDTYGSYHRRIQKKWNKRHGTKFMDQVIFANGIVYITQKMDILLKEMK